MDPDLLQTGAIWYVVFLFSTICHEAAHAFAGTRLGDETARGQVTLSPLPHLRREPIGMIVAPLLSFAAGGYMIGWASTPYSVDWANQYPRRAALMSLAGPLANFFLMLLAVALIYVGVFLGIFGAPDSINFSHVVQALDPAYAPLGTVLSILFTLNLLLATFNLLPLPPMDGSGAIGLLMSPDMARSWRSKRSRWNLIGLLVAWQLFGFIFGPIHHFAINLLYPGTTYH